MAINAAERIRHYNDILVGHHKFVDGRVLRGFGLRTRIFAWQNKATTYAWGADYTPLPGVLSVLSTLLVREGYDEELGAPGTPTCEGWLSIARASRRGQATSLTRYEYSTGAIRGLRPHVAIDSTRINVPFSEITTTHIRAGLGHWRGITKPPEISTSVVTAERLANALQLATSQVIAQT